VQAGEGCEVAFLFARNMIVASRDMPGVFKRLSIPPLAKAGDIKSIRVRPHSLLFHPFCFCTKVANACPKSDERSLIGGAPKSRMFLNSITVGRAPLKSGFRLLIVDEHKLSKWSAPLNVPLGERWNIANIIRRPWGWDNKFDNVVLRSNDGICTGIEWREGAESSISGHGVDSSMLADYRLLL